MMLGRLHLYTHAVPFRDPIPNDLRPIPFWVLPAQPAQGIRQHGNDAQNMSTNCANGKFLPRPVLRVIAPMPCAHLPSHRARVRPSLSLAAILFARAVSLARPDKNSGLKHMRSVLEVFVFWSSPTPDHCHEPLAVRSPEYTMHPPYTPALHAVNNGPTELHALHEPAVLIRGDPEPIPGDG
ncbi:hypothetical protein N7462_009522 [Penicillium macrosclerotiorum]|uniref:uncharacterized protein n=1 Tax=Penicillium macrosclerotiorum TaxID=303699 RepID=UPI0025482B46|nr:uncharacterized protein N7462_009522 [Penicillium macrosclerotiorum]KAJ5674083.1 hypothetical protein N7462_009522 [Penicillium macrosclerotiorum]